MIIPQMKQKQQSGVIWSGDKWNLIHLFFLFFHSALFSVLFMMMKFMSSSLNALFISHHHVSLSFAICPFALLFNVWVEQIFIWFESFFSFTHHTEIQLWWHLTFSNKYKSRAARCRRLSAFWFLTIWN